MDTLGPQLRLGTEAEETGLLYLGQDADTARSVGHVPEEGVWRKRAWRFPIAAAGLALLAVFAFIVYASSNTSTLETNKSVISQDEKLVFAEDKEKVRSDMERKKNEEKEQDDEDEKENDEKEEEEKDDEEEEKKDDEEKDDKAPKCSKPGENCKESKCCAWGNQQCYAKDEKYANCRNSCVPGPDFRDVDKSPWTCKKLGKRTPGKGIEDPPITKLPDWVKTECAKPGENCKKMGCCAWGNQQCFEKNKGFANCRNWCTPGPDFYDQDPGHWSCKSHGPKTPGKGIDPPMLEYEKLPKWFKKTCSKDGDSCAKSQCCISEGTQCYEKTPGYAICMEKCRPGPQFFDGTAEPWTCKTFGPRTPGKAKAVQAIKRFDQLPKWVGEKCAKDGEDCSKKMCCKTAGAQCYKKKEGWAVCKEQCVPGPDPSDNNKEWSCEALGPRTPISCPACAPKTVSHPDIVIPFFERDLCKLKYTAKSLSVNDPDHVFGKVHLMWISKQPSSQYAADLAQIKADISKTHELAFRDFTGEMATAGISGWHSQQLLKLKMASEVGADYYVVMDAKNTLIRPVTMDMFFTPCNQAIIQAEFPWYKIPVPHSDWYARSAAYLQVAKPSSRSWPASITPIIMHKQSVLNMLSKLGEGANTGKFCEGSLCEHIGAFSESGHGATEFTLYTLYVYENPTHTTELECIHKVEEMNHFKLRWSPDWKNQLDTKLRELNFPVDKQQVTVSDGRGFPIDWNPSITDWAPEQSAFPLKFEDLSKKWASSLWRGEPSNKAKLEVVNIHTLEDIVNGVRQFPIMFGAQPAATKLMSPDIHGRALDALLKIYKKANLYYGDAQGLEACVVGYHN